MLVEIGDGGMADDVISHRPQFRGRAERSRNEHARSRRRPELRGSRPPARRSQTPPRHRDGRRRRPHRQAARRARQGRRLCGHEEIRRSRQPAGECHEEAGRLCVPQRQLPLPPPPLRGRGSSRVGVGVHESRASKVHKPHLDEMHGPESLPYRPTRATPRKPELGSGSKIFQPTDSRQSGPEFGPAPRSSGGAPGHRGGWKKR